MATNVSKVFSSEDTRLTQISPSKERDWELQVNGVAVKNVESMQLSSKKGHAIVRYGSHPGGWDQFTITEPGGGGAITLPYFFKHGKLYIGLIWEERVFESCREQVLNAPRAFMAPDSSHFETAEELISRETGYKAPEKRVHSLETLPKNPNSAFFETWFSDNHGCTFFGLPMMESEIDFSGNRPKINNTLLDAKKESKVGNKIMKCVFFQWDEINVSDMFTHAGISSLLRYLAGSGKIGVQLVVTAG